MLRRMQAKPNIDPDPWFLYILECRDGSFYTGITKDIKRRLHMHEAGRASSYTRTRRPVRLLYEEPCSNRVAALVRECAVKALSRKEKEILITRKFSLASLA